MNTNEEYPKKKIDNKDAVFAVSMAAGIMLRAAECAVFVLLLTMTLATAATAETGFISDLTGGAVSVGEIAQTTTQDLA